MFCLKHGMFPCIIRRQNAALFLSFKKSQKLTQIAFIYSTRYKTPKHRRRLLSSPRNLLDIYYFYVDLSAAVIKQITKTLLQRYMKYNFFSKVGHWNADNEKTAYKPVQLNSLEDSIDWTGDYWEELQCLLTTKKNWRKPLDGRHLKVVTIEVSGPYQIS